MSDLSLRVQKVILLSPFVRLQKLRPNYLYRAKKGSFGISSTWKVEKKAGVPVGALKKPAKLFFKFLCKLLESFTLKYYLNIQKLFEFLFQIWLVLNVWQALVIVTWVMFMQRFIRVKSVTFWNVHDVVHTLSQDGGFVYNSSSQ